MRSRVTIKDQELRKYYNGKYCKYVPRANDSRNVAHIPC
jgi:hypothetical protein